MAKKLETKTTEEGMKKTIVVDKPDKPTPKPEKAIKSSKIAERKTDKKPNGKPNAEEEQMLATLTQLSANGLKEITSTLLRDKLGLDKESGRDQVRRVMANLAKDGKVTVTQRMKGKAKQFLFSLKEP